MVKRLVILYMCFVSVLGMAQNRRVITMQGNTATGVLESDLKVDASNVFNYWRARDSAGYWTAISGGIFYNSNRVNIGNVSTRYSKLNVQGGVNADSIILGGSNITGDNTELSINTNLRVGQPYGIGNKWTVIDKNQITFYDHQLGGVYVSTLSQDLFSMTATEFKAPVFRVNEIWSNDNYKVAQVISNQLRLGVSTYAGTPVYIQGGQSSWYYPILELRSETNAPIFRAKTNTPSTKPNVIIGSPSIEGYSLNVEGTVLTDTLRVNNIPIVLPSLTISNEGNFLSYNSITNAITTTSALKVSDATITASNPKITFTNTSNNSVSIGNESGLLAYRTATSNHGFYINNTYVGGFNNYGLTAKSTITNYPALNFDGAIQTGIDGTGTELQFKINNGTRRLLINSANELTVGSPSPSNSELTSTLNLLTSNNASGTEQTSILNSGTIGMRYRVATNRQHSFEINSVPSVIITASGLTMQTGTSITLASGSGATGNQAISVTQSDATYVKKIANGIITVNTTIANNSFHTQTATVTGVADDDIVMLHGANQQFLNMTVSIYKSSTNTITLYLYNNSGGNYVFSNTAFKYVVLRF